MNRLLLSSILLFLLYFAFGVFYSQLELGVVEGEGQSSRFYYDYSGVINVHSQKSSGSKSVQDIINSAKEAKLDFVIFHEENTINKKQPPAIKFGNLNVFYGQVLNYKGSKILYADINNDKTFTSFSEVQLYLSDYFENGGEELVILSHPERKAYRWKDPQPHFISGVEALNLRELWREAWEKNKMVFLSSLLFYPFNPKFFFLNLYAAQPFSRKFWNSWNDKQLTYAFMATDVTSKLKYLGGEELNFPGYKNIFLMASNHVLLEEELLGLRENSKILEALKSGSFYFSVDIFGSPKGFSFFLEKAGAKRYSMGSSLSLERGQKLRVELPNLKEGTNFKIRFFKGDQVYQEGSLDSLNVTEAGTYRVEVLLKPLFPLLRKKDWMTWIISNPIKVMSKVEVSKESPDPFSE